MILQHIEKKKHDHGKLISISHEFFRLSFLISIDVWSSFTFILFFIDHHVFNDTYNNNKLIDFKHKKKKPLSLISLHSNVSITHEFQISNNNNIHNHIIASKFLSYVFFKKLKNCKARMQRHVILKYAFNF